MQEMMKKEETGKLDDISGLILKGLECWVEAGEIIADFLDNNPSGMSEITKASGLDETIIRRFYSIGRHELHPMILCSTSLGVQKLARCPYNEQERYLEEPISVQISGGDKLNVGVKNLTKEQVKQVFSRDHVRTAPEQKAWMEAEQRKTELAAITKSAEAETMGYVIHGRNVVFRKGMRLTVGEMRNILLEMG